jgi:hypothetical protein
MKIMALADIHSRLDYPRSVIEELRAVDLVIIAGDITNFGDHDEAKRVIEGISRHNANVLAVPGNCDRSGVARALNDYGMNLHATGRIVNDVTLMGVGGCNKTPFHTPTEYTEKEMERLLGEFRRRPEMSKYILVTHAPPHKTKLDRMFIGFHVGSKAIRGFIEHFEPDLVICGHIHEAQGVDRIGKTVVLNPGPFPRHYASIIFDETLHYELH